MCECVCDALTYTGCVVLGETWGALACEATNSVHTHKLAVMPLRLAFVQIFRARKQN